MDSSTKASGSTTENTDTESPLTKESGQALIFLGIITHIFGLKKIQTYKKYEITIIWVSNIQKKNGMVLIIEFAKQNLLSCF